jgi:chemotaxis protein methyltransferase CheR
VERAEVEALVAALRTRYGYDFEHYARASFERRVRQAVQNEGLDSISELTQRALRDEHTFGRFLTTLSVHVTTMFRDPELFRCVRERVIPWLRTFPFVRIWHAGCATGEEVYSMCVLLYEAGLYDRARIYATDLSEDVLLRARRATYPLRLVRRFTDDYRRSGGRADFSAYYTADHSHAMVRDFLRKNVIFAQHNLASDASFNEFHLVCCRNVLIYFDDVLKARALGLFQGSLVRGGYLALGRREPLGGELGGAFDAADPELKLYRVRAP